MPKAKPATQGHNSGDLSDDDQAALQLSFSHRIRMQLKAAGVKKAEYDAERTLVNKLFSSARGELGINRKDFEEMLLLQDMDEDKFIAAEEARSRRFAAQGLPVGTQMDMFGSGKGDTADDAARVYAQGKRAGRRGDDGVLPETVNPMFASDWTRGWGDGQAELVLGLDRANALIAAREAKGVMVAEDDDDTDRDEQDGEDDGEIDQAEVDAQAKKLKGSDWAKPTPAEAEFAAA